MYGCTLILKHAFSQNDIHVERHPDPLSNGWGESSPFQHLPVAEQNRDWVCCVLEAVSPLCVFSIDFFLPRSFEANISAMSLLRRKDCITKGERMLFPRVGISSASSLSATITASARKNSSTCGFSSSAGGCPLPSLRASGSHKWPEFDSRWVAQV